MPFSVALCASVSSPRIRWSSITFLVSRLRTSWSVVSRPRSSSLVSPSPSITPVCWSSNATFASANRLGHCPNQRKVSLNQSITHFRFISIRVMTVCIYHLTWLTCCGIRKGSIGLFFEFVICAIDFSTNLVLTRGRNPRNISETWRINLER